MWIRWCVCALALALSLCAAHAQSRYSLQEEWLAGFSRGRAHAGALPLRPSPVLAQVAQQQAEEMARRGLRSPTTQAISERLRQVGYSAHDWREYFSVEDNAPRDLRATLNGTLNGHFRDLGVGTAVAGGFTFRVFLF